MEENNKCPVCDCIQYDIYEYNIRDNYMKICKKCKLVYVNKIIEYDYTKYIGQRQIQTNLNEQRKKQYVLDLEYINKNHNLQSGNCVLDMGCSDGTFLTYFPKDLIMFGYDPDCNAIDIAKRKIEKGIFYSKFEDLDKINYKMDVIIYRGSLQFVTNLQEHLAIIKKLLKQNGCIILLSIPNSDSLCSQIQREKWIMYNIINHVNIFNIVNLKLLFYEYNMIHYEFPYIGTPYENYEEDIKKFKQVLINKESDVKFPFFGNMISCCFVNSIINIHIT
jgi:2-polyprenyl-3-methyl-5-hydroxy-6-metoxy-1,4-benzoquinol methylase